MGERARGGVAARAGGVVGGAVGAGAEGERGLKQSTRPMLGGSHTGVVSVTPLIMSRGFTEATTLSEGVTPSSNVV